MNGMAWSEGASHWDVHFRFSFRIGYFDFRTLLNTYVPRRGATLRGARRYRQVDFRAGWVSGGGGIAGFRSFLIFVLAGFFDALLRGIYDGRGHSQDQEHGTGEKLRAG